MDIIVQKSTRRLAKETIGTELIARLTRIQLGSYCFRYRFDVSIRKHYKIPDAAKVEVLV